MAVYAVGGNIPRIHPTSFVHPLASVIGRVEIGPGCFIGPFAALRGDWVTIEVGAGSNVQDSCVIHGYAGDVVVLEEDSHLGHGCIVHGAHVGRNVLIGMNAVIQDGVELGESCVVGAGCVVPAGLVVPPLKLVLGVPGRIVADVRPELAKQKRIGTAWYQQLAEQCLRDFQEVPLQQCITETVSGPPWRVWMKDPEEWLRGRGTHGRQAVNQEEVASGDSKAS